MSVQLHIVPGKPSRKPLVFPTGDYFIGRGPECQISLNSELVSRQHCLLRVDAGAAYLRDLGSKNGTLVNGKLVAGEQPLLSGDQVQIGPLMFEVQFDAEAAQVDTIKAQVEETAQVEPAYEELNPQAEEATVSPAQQAAG